MILSMTGYGKSESDLSFAVLNVEARSVNSKQLDLNLHLPSVLKEKEDCLRSVAGKKLLRGKVDIDFNIEWGNSRKNQIINRELAKKYYDELNSLQQDINTQSSDILSLILKMPDVISNEKISVENSDWNLTEKAMLAAIDHLIKFRAKEGKMLEKDIMQHIDIIEHNLDKIKKIEPKRAIDVRKRLLNRMQEYNISPDIDRFEQELIYYLEKLDINEEMVRLTSHCDYFKETIGDTEPIGKKLGFIIQEMGREINTIGSKANNAEIQKLVILMKDALEQIKEQVLNVL